MLMESKIKRISDLLESHKVQMNLEKDGSNCSGVYEGFNERLGNDIRLSLNLSDEYIELTLTFKMRVFDSLGKIMVKEFNVPNIHLIIDHKGQAIYEIIKKYDDLEKDIKESLELLLGEQIKMEKNHLFLSCKANASPT